jgi:hypothetical protein
MSIYEVMFIAFLLCWLVLPVYTQSKRHWQTYPWTGHLRADHRWGFLFGIVVAGIIFLIGRVF